MATAQDNHWQLRKSAELSSEQGQPSTQGSEDEKKTSLKMEGGE